MKDIWKLLVSIVVCLSVAVFGSSVTIPSIGSWYQTLNKPVFNPPNWVFAPVWTILFLLMAISAYLIWSKGLRKKGVKEALAVFLIQLGLNFFWSYLFFGLHSPLLAFVDIIVLWLAIFFTILKFSLISKNAAYLLLPYLLWVSFAASLNYMIMVLN